jgi:regulator of RNase E activity RraA
MRTAIEPYLGKLAGFQTADQIRDFLVGENVKAAVGGSTTCAIAEYVYQQTDIEVMVDYDGVWFHHPDMKLGDGTGRTSIRDYASRVGEDARRVVTIASDMTDAMIKFIQLFDSRYYYPELVKEDA